MARKTTGLVAGCGERSEGIQIAMKTYCKHMVIDRAHVAEAYGLWRASDAGRKNRWRVAEEHSDEDALIDEITGEIAARGLSFAPIRRYRRTEPTNGKLRVIGIESVKQQVCDYVAVLALEPFLAARAGFYQVACVKGKGAKMAARAARKWVHQGGYYVHLDVRKCYPSISHGVVLGILRRYVRSADVLYVCAALLATYDEGGLEIGSYFSLRMSQLVLSFGYHHIEGLGKTRRGRRVPLVAHQLWWQDDIWLFAPDKRNLKMAARSLGRFMAAACGLGLKRWKVCPVSDAEPVDMAGFVVREGRTTVRAGIFLRARRSFRRFARRASVAQARRVVSYYGWLKNTDSRRFMRDNGIEAAKRDACRMVSAHERMMRNGAFDFSDTAGCCAG